MTPGLASVAVAVRDHNGHPVASIAVTFESDADPSGIAEAVTGTAAQLEQRLRGRH